MDDYGGARPKTTRPRPRRRQEESEDSELTDEPSTSRTQSCSDERNRRRRNLDEELLEQERIAEEFLRESQAYSSSSRFAWSRPPPPPPPPRSKPPVLQPSGSQMDDLDLAGVAQPRTLTPRQPVPLAPTTRRRHRPINRPSKPPPPPPVARTEPWAPSKVELPTRLIAQALSLDEPYVDDMCETEQYEYDDDLYDLYASKPQKMLSRQPMSERGIDFYLNQPRGAGSKQKSRRARTTKETQDSVDCDLAQQLLDLSIKEDDEEDEISWDHFSRIKHVDYKQYYARRLRKTRETPLPIDEENKVKHPYYKSTYRILYRPAERSPYHKQQLLNWDYFLEEEEDSDGDEC